MNFKNFVSLALSPFWLLDRESNDAIRRILEKKIKAYSHWLDVGCGLKPFEQCFDWAHYTGIDIEFSGRAYEMKAPNKLFDGINIPYEENKFDGLLCTQVLEHAEKLDLPLSECNRD